MKKLAILLALVMFTSCTIIVLDEHPRPIRHRQAPMPYFSTFDLYWMWAWMPYQTSWCNDYYYWSRMYGYRYESHPIPSSKQKITKRQLQKPNKGTVSKGSSTSRVASGSQEGTKVKAGSSGKVKKEKIKK